MLVGRFGWVLFFALIIFPSHCTWTEPKKANTTSEPKKVATPTNTKAARSKVALRTATVDCLGKKLVLSVWWVYTGVCCVEHLKKNYSSFLFFLYFGGLIPILYTPQRWEWECSSILWSFSRWRFDGKVGKPIEDLHGRAGQNLAIGWEAQILAGKLEECGYVMYSLWFFAIFANDFVSFC